MEKLTYSERAKAVKTRLPPRNEIETFKFEVVPQSRMDNDCRKSRDKDLSWVPTSSERSNAGLEESENVTRSQREEKKMAFKLYCKKKKEEVKKEKQREREEKMLKKIVGPKGESVSVINRDTFHKLSFAKSPSTAMQSNNGLNLDSFSFPDLRQSLTRTPRKLSAKDENLTSGEVTDKVVERVESQVSVSNKVPVKSRKKRDPVVVDILKAIEVCKAEKQPSKKTTISASGKKNAQTVLRVGGNILDSSNPLRHRGKKREAPKKHCMTRLKKAIMLEREKRRALRDINKKKMSSTMGSDGLKEGNSVTSMGKTESGVNQEKSVERLEVTLDQPFAPSNNRSYGDVIQEDDYKKIVDVDAMVKEKIHSKKFREYCNHFKRQDLSEAVTSMLQDIIRFQDRAYANQPIKAEMHRRYVLGLKQTNNLLSVQKVKIIIMASDIEKVPAPGGLDDVVATIIDSAAKQNVPVIFSFPRRQLGKLTYRKVPVSCIAILNYHGTEVAYHKMTETLEAAKKEYQERFTAEKLRIMNELGISMVKMEQAENVVKTVKPESDISSSLLKRLTEAISELSVQSSHNSEEINEALSFRNSIL